MKDVGTEDRNDTQPEVPAVNRESAREHYDLGQRSEDEEDFAAAAGHYRQAIKVDPDYVAAYTRLGVLLLRQEKRALAVRLFEHALQVDPEDRDAHYFLAETFAKQGRSVEAIECYETAADLDPDFAEAAFGSCIGQLPIIYDDPSDMATRRRAYRRSLENLAERYAGQSRQQRARAAKAVGAKQPFYLAYQGENDRSLQKTYGDMIARLMMDRHPRWSKSVAARDPGNTEKTRVGFVSRFFYDHSNWKIPIKGWVENLDRSRFELFGYHTGSSRDWATSEAEQAFHKFVQGSRRLEAWGEEIEGDRLDVLIFPEFGMDPTTAALGCLRLAPVQMTSWGHPETSGLPTIDYYLSSDLMEPENAQDHYSERLVRLPNLSVHYTPLTVTPERQERADLGVGPDEVMFWCCQSLYKYLPQHDDVFPRIARELGACKFVFIKYSLDEEDPVTDAFKTRLRRAFETMGLSYQDHCVFVSRLSADAYAGTVQIADVFLDSIGWSGCNSTLEAIAFDLPVVTLPGDVMRARHSYAVLKMMGLEETIAVTMDDYVRIAVRLGRDRGYRQELRRKVAGTKHKIYSDEEPVRALEALLEDVVRNPATVNQRL